jgi:rhodanese-related sulfurtransferase
MAEIERIMRTFRESKKSLETLTSSELIKKMKAGEVTILDVRPEQEFREGHIAGALNVPVEELEDKLDDLPSDREIVAYCRGPFCVFADEAVELLHEKGFNAKRLDEGYPEWVLEELPVE